MLSKNVRIHSHFSKQRKNISFFMANTKGGEKREFHEFQNYFIYLYYSTLFTFQGYQNSKTFRSFQVEMPSLKQGSFQEEMPSFSKEFSFDECMIASIKMTCAPVDTFSFYSTSFAGHYWESKSATVEMSSVVMKNFNFVLSEVRKVLFHIYCYNKTT